MAFAHWAYLSESNNIYKVSGIDGLSPEEIVAKYGPADRRETFPLSDTLLEYRYGLLEQFPHYRDTTVEIMEMFWNRSSPLFAVWFCRRGSEWVVVDNLRWSKRIQF